MNIIVLHKKNKNKENEILMVDMNTKDDNEEQTQKRAFFPSVED